MCAATEIYCCNEGKYLFLSMLFGWLASRTRRNIALNKYFDRSRSWSEHTHGYTSNCRPNFPLNVSGDYIGSSLYAANGDVISQWNPISLSAKRIPDLHWFVSDIRDYSINAFIIISLHVKFVFRSMECGV